MSIPKSFKELPSYDELPNKRRYWVWGPPGSHKEGLGMLNLLTPDHVSQSAKNEIQTGKRVGLGWEFHKLEYPNFDRALYNMKIYRSSPVTLDDEYHFNPQQSSQWDGLRHHSQPDAEKGLVWYGGTTEEEIFQEKSDRIGISHWAKEGIAGRGVLLDFASWAKAKGIQYSTMSTREITLDELKQVGEYYNVKFEPGDILFIRIGFIEEWNALSEQQMKDYRNKQDVVHAGIEATEEMVKWLWNNHFCAIAGDAVSLELFPMKDLQFTLHQFLLTGWGVPIGEMFNLDGLAQMCKDHKRYSFFVTSMPFNAVGGVSSAPNAMAIF